MSQLVHYHSRRNIAHVDERRSTWKKAAKWSSHIKFSGAHIPMEICYGFVKLYFLDFIVKLHLNWRKNIRVSTQSHHSIFHLTVRCYSHQWYFTFSLLLDSLLVQTGLRSVGLSRCPPRHRHISRGRYYLRFTATFPRRRLLAVFFSLLLQVRMRVWVWLWQWFYCTVFVSCQPLADPVIRSAFTTGSQMGCDRRLWSPFIVTTSALAYFCTNLKFVRRFLLSVGHMGFICELHLAVFLHVVSEAKVPCSI